jgi:uncharacterized protein (DUF4415 family)
MTEWKPASAFKQATEPDDQLEIDPAILAWFKARGRGWQQELNGVRGFYIDTVEHPASEPDHEQTGPEPGP